MSGWLSQFWSTLTCEGSEFNAALPHKLISPGWSVYRRPPRLFTAHLSAQVLQETVFVLFKHSKYWGREQSGGGGEQVSLSERAPPTEHTSFISPALVWI